ncbi:MAG: hypothetical protein IPN32_23400 [Deltaproteobacteria bacterium]|nr:hypothetical protein [Deltaproteobacteria bacterium]
MDDATTPTATHAVGIDLGTTHCALAYARLDRPHVRLMAIPQLVAPGELAAAPLLPSFLYLPASEELTAADRALPWAQPDVVVGEAARRLGAKVPARLVASAKSWVCHGGVDRRAPILPWNAPESLPHVSPYAAQVATSPLRAAWDPPARRRAARAARRGGDGASVVRRGRARAHRRGRARGRTR